MTASHGTENIRLSTAVDLPSRWNHELFVVGKVHFAMQRRKVDFHLEFGFLMARDPLLLLVAPGLVTCLRWMLLV